MTTFTATVAASEIIKTAHEGGGSAELGGKRQTKDEYRKNKELEEGRKAGTVPAVTDVETGRDINPHIPQFIAQAPWYAGAKGATLKHQRPHPERVEKAKVSEFAEWYKRGTTGKIATKFRKGACANCGAMTHQTKECFERPRKVGAKWTGEDIAPDEYLQPKLKQHWDAKRDRWNGYNPDEHKHTIEEYQRLEEARKMIKAVEQQDEPLKQGEDDAEVAEEKTKHSNDGDDETEAQQDEDLQVDEDKYAEDADMPGVKVDNDSRTRITVRNLRIREDTAKYLYNLDPNSAYYDPKSRAMRENPFAGLSGKDLEAVKFSGENFVQYSGEVIDVNKLQLFAWEAKRRGIDAHTLAEPTKLERLHKDLTEGKHALKDEHKRAVVEKYGGEEHLHAPPKELLLAQTEAYVEYNRKGKVLKGEERPVVRSRYPEDVYHNNHTSVWGSWWQDGRWGYACCHSTVKNSYCVGESGKTVEKGKVAGNTDEKLAGAEKNTDLAKEKSSKDKQNQETSSSSASSSSSSSDDSSSEEEEDDSDTSEKEKEKNKERAEAVARAEHRREQKRKRRARQLATRRDSRKSLTNRRPSNSDEDVASSSSEEDEQPQHKKQKTHDAPTKKSTKDAELAAALERRERLDAEGERVAQLDDRQRAYNKHYEIKAPTEHDMEAYRLTQLHADDPMAEYMREKKTKK